jgi:ribosomal-protein-alanine N-acetyltransferase
MILKNSQLILRPQIQSDAPEMFAILRDPLAMRFWNRPPLTHLTIVEGLVREQQAAMAQGLCRYWTALLKDAVIGSVDLSLIQDGSAELGFLFRPDHWGMGLASEAAGAVIAHAGSDLGLTRLAAVVQTENRAAARVLEKNGFGLIEARPVLLADGQKKDCAFYLRQPPSV